MLKLLQTLQDLLSILASVDPGLLAGLLLATGVVVAIGAVLYRRRQQIQQRTASTRGAYGQVVEPYLLLLVPLGAGVVLDLWLLYAAELPPWGQRLEVPCGVLLAVAWGWLWLQLSGQFFDDYLVERTVRRRRRLNGEIFNFTKFLANGAALLAILLAFCITHSIEVLGLLASLGVGGVAIAFAAQKTLEQILGGIVLYVDRPFVANDYIGLADGTLGRVEAIGLRSTRIRVAGKGTVLIVPNSALTTSNVENYTEAQKIISIVSLTFNRALPEDEKALIRQTMLASTRDLIGIDPRNTTVTFKDFTSATEATVTQAQLNLFILGSGKFSADLRRQLIDSAKLNIDLQLREYGIPFDLEEQTINIDSPITI